MSCDLIIISAMPKTNFIDHVRLHCRSGKGGAGSSHFRREKHVAQGGPDGGDGGRGGHIILRGSNNQWTLLHLRYRKHIFAKDGNPGGPSQSSGAMGIDMILEVPLGTVAMVADTHEPIGEITENGQELVLLQGGRGGLGNTHFKSALNQSPQHAQPGEDGLEEIIVLELKMLADVGLVGFPNTGKSTLLSVVSAAKPEIANYEFTTITPNVGVVSYYDDQSFVMADIPGIIEGASEGKGLGHQFLRHIERNPVLLFIIPADTDDINEAYRILLEELRKYNPEMLDKNRILGISKADLAEGLIEEIKAEITIDIPYLFFSSITQQGIPELKNLIWENLS